MIPSHLLRTERGVSEGRAVLEEGGDETDCVGTRHHIPYAVTRQEDE